MGRKLRMYNVEFGDAFLLYGEQENLLVDLGSISGMVNFDKIRDSVGVESGDKRLSLLLTHFHEDHWAGLHNQTAGHQLPTLNTVYLPDIFQMRIVGELDVIMRDLLGDFFEAVILKSKPRFTLADLLRDVIPKLDKTAVRFLVRGDLFEVDGKKYEVLWPRLDREDVTKRSRKEFQEFLERTQAKLTAGGGEVELVDTVDKLANAILTEFRLLLGEESRFTWGEQRTYGELYEQIESLWRILSAEAAEDEGEYYEKVRRYAERLKKDWNQVSVVFHEYEGEGILMTGDITKEILKKLVNGSLGGPQVRKKYAVIKAPHHGTNSHFCATLPQCRYLCISNGEGNPHYQRIAEEYERGYAAGGGVELHCTNRRCEYFEQVKSCPFFATRSVGDFYDVAW